MSSPQSRIAGGDDPVLLRRARGGDADAFRELLEPRQAELHAHCHRMLGSVYDAEDALQDAMLRAWRELAGFDGLGSLRSWLYAIATNSCLNQLGRATSACCRWVSAHPAHAGQRAARALVALQTVRSRTHAVLGGRVRAVARGNRASAHARRISGRGVCADARLGRAATLSPGRPGPWLAGTFARFGRPDRLG
jgi:hypothetical protein